MKKFIFILVIAIIAMGSVFAEDPTGTAQIKIETKITEGLPTFRLDTDKTDVKALVGGTGTYTITPDALLSGDQTVNFTIMQVANSRTTKNYKLTVTATDLVAIQPADVDDADWADSKIPAEQKKFVVEDGTPTITKGAVTGIKLSASENDLIADYIGQLVETTTGPVTLGTFSCTWKQQAKAVVATYEATVTLTITSTT